MLQNACLLAKIGADTAENERKFAEILRRSSRSPSLAKFREHLANFGKKKQNISAVFKTKIEIIFSRGCFGPGAFFFPRAFRLRIPKRCKGVHCVDLGDSFPFQFPTSIYLQTFTLGRYSRERVL